MKKLLLVILLVVLPFILFSEAYQIVDSEYEIEGAGFKFMGKTREYPLQRNFPLDKRTVFKDRQAFENYISNYEQTLISSRYFDEVSVKYEATPSETEELYYVHILINIKDSHHLILMPYPKYSSNTGLSLKLKAKDSNFFGSLNTMNADVNLTLDSEGFKPGFTFSFDAPFSAGPFDAVFVNDYSLNYALSEDYQGFEWDTETGLKLSLPFNRFSIDFGIYQYTYRDFSYREYDDELYFSEEIKFGVPVILTTLSNFTEIVYGPSVGIIWNWDFDGINPENDDLSGPEVSFSHSISNGKITWNNNFRKGYNLNLSNSFVYNIQRDDIVPSVQFDAQFFWNYQTNEQDIWNRFGICTNFSIFHYFDISSNTYKYGSQIGQYLRGILDENYFGNEKPYGTASSAILLNLDLPHNVFTAYFPKEILNFNLQFSPFFDMALVYDRESGRYFSFEDGFYCGGFELLIYPLNWSSFTIRASIGVDLRSNIFVEGLKQNKEIFIGIGLQY